MGAPITLETCVVICRACRISAHRGGWWRNTEIYKDIRKLPMAE